MGFAGMERDTVTGLNLAVNRVENPGTGRWDSQDPLGLWAGVTDLYRYVGNGPTNEADRYGLQQGIGGQHNQHGGGSGGQQGGDLLPNPLEPPITTTPAPFQPTYQFPTRRPDQNKQKPRPGPEGTQRRDRGPVDPSLVGPAQKKPGVYKCPVARGGTTIVPGTSNPARGKGKWKKGYGPRPSKRA